MPPLLLPGQQVWGQRGRQPMQDRKQTQGGVLESWPRPHKKSLHCCTDISEKAIGTTEPQKSRLSEGGEEDLCSGPLLFPVPLSCREQLNPLLLIGHSAGSNSSWLHGLQHARLPCPSPTPRVCSNLRPLSWWCHPTISSYVIPFSACPQSFPASGSFPMRLFASGGQSIRASASASVLPVNIQGAVPSRIDGFDLAVQRTLKSLLQHDSLKASVFWRSVFFMVQLLHPYMTTGKSIVLTALTIQTFVGKGISLLFNYIFNHYLDPTLSKFVIAFLPRRKHIFYFMVAITICSDFGGQENKSCTFRLFPSCRGSWWGSQMLIHRKYCLGTWECQQEPEPVWDPPSEKDA